MEAKRKQHIPAVLPQQPTGTVPRQLHSPLKAPTRAGGGGGGPTVHKRKPSALANRDQQLPGRPKHTVKFKEQGDQEILVVTVEPPLTPSPGSAPPSSSSQLTTCQLPALATTSESSDRPGTAAAKHRGGTPYPSNTGSDHPPGGRQEKVKSTERSSKSAAKKSATSGDAVRHQQHGQRLSEGCTTLMYACQQGLTEEIVRELREKPDVVHRRDRNNRGALHYASSSKDIVAAASVAMVAPELIEQADEDGFTPLHLAVIQGNLQLVNLLLANGADVNALDNEGHSVVHWATVCGEVEALRSVLAAGADVSTPDINGGSPLHYAAQMCGANYEGKTARASAKLALEILGTLLAHPDTSVEVEDKDGRQPLLWAASAGSAKAVLALIKAGAQVESADKDGLTALHCAASRGHTECIDTLINLCGAHTDQIDSNGCTALHYSVTLGHADATSLLLKLEADPNRQDRKGRTPAHCGCAKGQIETVKILHVKKGNLWLRNAKGDFPVHDAASSGRRQLVQWLLQMKPKHINTPSNDGRTLLHIAAGHDNVDMCKLLLESGAEMNHLYRPAKGSPMTPLDYALVKGFRSTAKFLQMQGGLPANKLRMSSRQQKILPDIDKVEPLKLTEKEELIDLKTSKRYVVYMNSNSESEGQDERSHRKSRHKRKGSHRSRRTSSCSDTVFLYREGAADISRSRSNVELNRSHHHRHRHRSSSSSSASTSETSSDDCCKHTKRRHKCYKKCSSKSARSKDRSHRERDRDREKEPKEPKEYEFMYAEQREPGKPRKAGERTGRIVLKQVHSGSSENESPESDRRGSSLRLTGKTGSLLTVPTEMLGMPDEQSLPKQPPRAEFNIRKASDTKSDDKSSDTSVKKVKKGKGNGKKGKATGKAHAKKTDSPSEEDTKDKEKLQAGEKVVTEAQVHPVPEIMMKSTEDDGAATDATYTIDQKTKSDNEGFSESETADKVRGKVKEKPETIVEAKEEAAQEVSQAIPLEVKEEVVPAPKKERPKLKSSKDSSSSRSSKSKSDSSEKEMPKPKLKPKPKEEETTPVVAEPEPQPPLPPPPAPEPEPEIHVVPEQEPTYVEPLIVVEAAKPEEEQPPAVVPDTEPVAAAAEGEAVVPQELQVAEPEPPEPEPGPAPEPEPEPTPEKVTEPELEPVEESPTEEKSSEVEESPSKSSEDQTEQQPSEPEEPPKTEPSTDQVLPSEQLPPISEEDTEKKVSFDRERPKLRRSAESLVEHVEEEEVRTEEDAVVPLAAAAAVDQEKVDSTRGFYVSLAEGEEGDEKKKRKLKKRKSKEDKAYEEAQGSKDQDSGFEPSPQSVRSKATVFDRPTSTAVLTKRPAFTMVEERAVSSRPDGRKPGDKNAVNMTTVQQSIQRNIRRYYMERKIFQHLLELKSLQIRSTKVNESALVKRAVDDYHKSTIELGYETGSTLKRYPYSEYSFKNFELFLYDTLKSLQKRETYNFQNISEVYDEAERRSSPDVSRYERALNCTTKTHRCLHATHAYTGIPCAAYIPMMNHHTMPKLGFGQYKSSSSGVGSFFLPKILTNPTDPSCPGSSASYLTPFGGAGASKGSPRKVSLTPSSSSPLPLANQGSSNPNTLVMPSIRPNGSNSSPTQAPFQLL
ncbi:ankyrin repeat domain-containing protein 12 isoform X2 [Armigeres subalbatus]|uniref:ankyrin repeat domain-containing protein 12 isoform X2 n=1 Tax=Armigeres subalbatus TaxID=124917 RepID=UPI002ED44CB7